LTKNNIPDSTPATRLAHAVLAELGEQMPFLLRASAAGKPPLVDRICDLEAIAARLCQVYGEPEKWLFQTVRGYVMLSLEFLKLQKKLEESGHYLLGSEREALQAAYDNGNVFGDYYLPGLLLSEALWPNHFLLNQAFKQSFLPKLSNKANVLEIGVGTGFHLDLILDGRSNISYTGLDISEYAINFAKTFAFGSSGENQQAQFIQSNVSDGIPVANNSIDAIVMGEVLEHIDDPAAVLRDMRRALKPDGSAFITTVAFAANIDHIFMFEKISDIRTMLTENGWRIIEDWPLPVYPSDTPDMEKRPMNYGALISPII
jgi:SAM-dependent methyltransferase